MPTIEQIMLTSPVIPVIVINDMDDAVPLAQALVNGGLKVLEVTLRTELGLQAITKIKQAIPEAIVGAGTVITPNDVDKSVAAGAEFLVSPGCTAALIDAALDNSVPLLPGVATPSEAMTSKGVRFEPMKKRAMRPAGPSFAVSFPRFFPRSVTMHPRCQRERHGRAYRRSAR